MAERAAGDMGEQQGEGENEGEGVSGSSQFSLFPVSVGGFSSFPGSTVQSAAARPIPSLFPSTGNVHVKQGPDGGQLWLHNPSFSESLLPPAPDFTAGKVIENLLGRETLVEFERRQSQGTNVEGRSNEPGTESGSSMSDADISKGEGEQAERKKSKAKRRRKQKKEEDRKRHREQRQTGGDDWQIGSLEGQSLDRKTVVKAWVDKKSKMVKEYYFDSRGDRDNIAFGSLYRMDVARYSRLHFEGGDEREGRRRNATTLDVPEAECAVQESKAYRYWSGEAMALERRRDFRRIRVRPLQPSRDAGSNSPNLSAFIPVGSHESEKEGKEEEGVQDGESWDDYITRRTREFNTVTRERPGDESVWLDFAAFQDELIQATKKKGAKQQVIDKKISILEKALEHHADSVELTLVYLQACSLRDTVAEVLSKWEKAVPMFSGSYRFWKEFLAFINSQFSMFSVSTIRALLIRALGALTAARDGLLNGKIIKQEDESKDHINDAELAIVAILADRCCFELQTGHAELALGIFQAAMEYTLFAPLIQPNESNKRRLFEAFWESQAPRIGEDGAPGWAAWLEREEEQIRNAQAQEAAEEEHQPGGWTGWSEQPIQSVTDKMVTEDNSGRDEEGEEDDESSEGEDANEDESTLLAKLGLSSIDAGKELEVKDVGVWQRWALEERKRGSEQWFPVHAQVGNDEKHGEKDDEELERLVAFEDIQDTLVSLTSDVAVCQLVGSFLEFCNVPFPNWCSSNHVSTQQVLERLEALTSSLGNLGRRQFLGGDILQQVVDSVKNHDGTSGEAVLRSLVGDTEWFLDSIMRARFVCSALLLLQTSSVKSLSKCHWAYTEVLLRIQGLTSESGLKESRALAKKLLKVHRQDIALWAAYAVVEAAAGNIDTARKVLDTTLTSLPSLPNEQQLDAPLLYLACADMEISYGSRTRALHVLCYFGAGIPYSLSSSTVDDSVPPTLVAKARFGFQQHLQNFRRAHICGLDAGLVNLGRPAFGGALADRWVAMVTCVAMFEELSSGWEAAMSVFEENLAFTLPGKRKYSKACEALMERYIALMTRSILVVKPAKVRQISLRGLMEYPYNSGLLQMFVQSSSSTHNLRRFFDDTAKKTPSTLLWMFALDTELGSTRIGNNSRIRSLFERALETKGTQQSVILWRTYLAYEFHINKNVEGARRVYFRAIHACPWSKKLWLDGFTKLSSVLTAKELAEFQEVMRDKGLRIRTDMMSLELSNHSLKLKIKFSEYCFPHDWYYKWGLQRGLSTSYPSQRFSAEYGHEPPDAVKVTWKDHTTFGAERKFIEPTDQSFLSQFMDVWRLKISTFYISDGNEHHGRGD